MAKNAPASNSRRDGAMGSSRLWRLPGGRRIVPCRALSTRRERLLRLLDEFAALDVAAGVLDADNACGRLTDMAEDTPFTIEDEGAPIQVMGVLEAAGSQFDAVWITGLHDGAWPQAAHPNPFLPVALQRELRMPHSSPDREYEFSRMALRRLLSAAPAVVLSWPQREGDTALPPSPLLPDAPEWTMGADSRWVPFLETRASGRPAGRDRSGAFRGRSVGRREHLQGSGACPFRAFAQRRLGAQPLERPQSGISPPERGTVLHNALDFFWRETETHARLAAMSAEQVLERARNCVEQAFEHRLLGSRLRDLEIERLAHLLVEWMDLERTRAPFRVVERETPQPVEIGGVRIKTRIDRVDELENGRHVIVDYKANAPSPNAWDSDRPAEPQVPLTPPSTGGALPACCSGTSGRVN